MGCASTLKQRVLTSEVEQALAATLYCLHKFSDMLCVTLQIEIRTPVAGVASVVGNAQKGAKL